jgi:uncharacterized protein YggE
MKTILTFLTAFILGPLSVFAQGQVYVSKPIIEISGSAEMVVAPDEIYVSVTLREFMIERKKQPIANIEKDFKEVINSLKIDFKLLSLEGVYGTFDYDYKTQKRGDFLNAKTYIIKFSDMDKYNQMVMMLDKKGIENIHIQRTGHSKMEEYRRKVKVEALKAAKEKADLLLAAIGKQTGEVQLIRERDNNMGLMQPMYLKSNVAMDLNSETVGQPIEMKKIKLRYEIEAHFLIAN